MMCLMTRNKKKNIGFLIGCIWYYIKRIENVQAFADATSILTELTVKLCIDWNTVESAEKIYETVVKSYEL